jgi:hypothetical protein
MNITLYPGESVQVDFSETDGQFEVHFSSKEHPNAIVVKETANITPTKIGAGDAVLYHDEFLRGDPEDMEVSDGDDDDDAEETPTGFFMDKNNRIHCTAFVHCEVVDAGWDSKDGSRQWKAQTLDAQDTVTGEYDFYRTLEELESVSGTKMARTVIA